VKPEARPRDKLVVAHPERKAQRTLQRLVGATMCPVEVVADIPSLLAAIDSSAIAVVDAGLAREHADLRTHDARGWIAVPGEGLTPADAACITALLAAGWDHVVAQPMPLLAEELLATVQKLFRKDVFGLEKYMAWGAEVRSYALEDARDREVAVAELAKDVVAAGLPDRIGSLVSVIADELIANAVYAAPVDDAGARFRAQEPRDQSRALTGRDAVTVRWATDARYLAIEVRDKWGSIDVADVMKKLAAGGSQVSEASDGGMGLSLAYACSNQFVINVTPNVMTEVITLVDMRYKPTELARTASFHAFRE
jgi:hypothetical protein